MPCVITPRNTMQLQLDVYILCVDGRWASGLSSTVCPHNPVQHCPSHNRWSWLVIASYSWSATQQAFKSKIQVYAHHSEHFHMLLRGFPLRHVGRSHKCASWNWDFHKYPKTMGSVMPRVLSDFQ